MQKKQQHAKPTIIRKWPIDQQKERWQRRPALLYPDNLPILDIKLQIIEALKTQQTLIIAAETGSGKSTQLPKILLEAGLGRHGKIACVQPRRIAATSIAKRIAYELGEPFGQSVGYRIRFDDQTQEQTFIQVMTDGMLLSELHHDRNLLEYDALIIDEAHERSLNIDLLLGLVKKILQKRPHFRLIIASATIDTERFSQFFDNAPILLAKGRHYDVEIRYQEPKSQEEDLLEQALRALQTISEESSQGDILIFLPTEDFIKNFIELASKVNSKEARTYLPLYARLSPSEQQRIFQETATRKVIVATNIAETSITLPTIRYVIDSGLARISQYSAQSRIQNLPIIATSQASAKQRSGRCGRVSNGVCIRLYSEADFLSRATHTEPEIKRANLSETILRMMAMRISEPEHFNLIDKPHVRLFNEGFKTLVELQAIDSLKKDRRKLTALGRAMSQLPLDPRLSRMLLAGDQEGALEEVTIIAAALSVMDLRSFSEDKREQAKAIHQTYHAPASDLLWYLNLYKAAKEQQKVSNNQLKRFCTVSYLHYMRVHEWLTLTKQISHLLASKGYKASRLGEERPWHTSDKHQLADGYAAIHRAVLSGYLSQIGIYQPAEVASGTAKGKNFKARKQACYKDMRLQEFHLFPTSSLNNQQWPWIFSTKMWRTSRLFARDAAAIDPLWLTSLAAHLMQMRASDPFYSAKAQEVVCTVTHYLYNYPITKYSNRSYAEFNVQQASLLFVTQCLLVKEMIEPLLNEDEFDFLRHNQALLLEIEQSQAKLRREAILVDEEALLKFYVSKLEGISSVVALRKKLRSQPNWAKKLYLDQKDLLVEASLIQELASYPSTVSLEQTTVDLEYQFQPNKPQDGVTVVLTPKQVQEIAQTQLLLWQPAGLLLARITAMIKQLPKPQRMQLHPTNQRAQEIVERIHRQGDLFGALAVFCKQQFGAHITATLWQEAYGKIDHHLKVQFAVRHQLSDKSDLMRSNSLEQLKQASFSQANESDFMKLAKTWQLNELESWPNGHEHIPEKVEVINDKGQAYGYAYPALHYDKQSNQVSLQLFEQQALAQAAHIEGVQQLLYKLLKPELSALKKHFKLDERSPHLNYFANYKQANQLFHHYLERQYLRDAQLRTKEAFAAYDSSEYRKELWQNVASDFQAFTQALKLFDELQNKVAKAMTKHQHHPHLQLLRVNLEYLAGATSWQWMSQKKLRRQVILLKTWQNRLDRALAHLAKDQQKSLTFLPYHEKLKEYQAKEAPVLTQLVLEEFSHILYEVELKSFIPEAKGLLYDQKVLEECFVKL